jgi:VanZ family protein
VEILVLFLSSRRDLHLPALIPHLDKLAHFVEYAGVGGVIYRALRLSGGGSTSSVGRTLLLVIGLGWGDEWFQSHIPGRDSGWPDWVADILGGACGACVARWLEGRLPARIWGLGVQVRARSR